MERGECEMPAVKSNALHTVSRSDTETLQGARQGLEHDSNLNGIIRERSEDQSGAERVVRGTFSQSGNRKRSARASSNLRKSLAWDKAFSTDEGVLDVDELPLVTKTPRKPLQLHLLDIPEILGKFSPAPLSVVENHNSNARAVDRGEMITSSPVQSSRQLESLSSGSPNSRTCETTVSKGSSLVVAPSHPDKKTSKLEGKSSASVGQIVKADALKGTRLRLPSSFTGKKGKNDMVPKPVSVPQSNFLRRCKSTSSILSPSSASAAFSKKVSSVSKKVKDTLGKVLPGSLGASAKHFKVKEDRSFDQGQAAKPAQTPKSHRHVPTEDDVNCPRPASVANSKPSKKKDAQVEANNQEVIPTEHLGNGTVIPSLTGSSKGSVAGTSSKKGSDNQSFYSSQVTSGISRKKPGPDGSQSPPVENANHVNSAQSSKGTSSGLRLPSPKIGFFDTPRSASGEHATLPEKVLGSASDTSNSKNSRKGLPPRPKHGLPSGRVQKPGCDGSLAKGSSKLVSSSIPSAPHLRPFGKSAEGLIRSGSAPTSPHRTNHGIRSSASPQAVTCRRLSPQVNSDQSHSCASELRTRTLRNAASGAVQNLRLESKEWESGPWLSPMEPQEVDAIPQVMGKPSGRSSTRHKQDVKFGNLHGDVSPSKVTNLSVGSTNPPPEQSLSGSLPSVVEDSRGANENVFCKEKEGATHVVSDELTVSSSIEPLVDSVCHKLPTAMLDGTLCPEFDRASSAQSASAPEFESCLVTEVFDKSTGDPVGESAVGSGEDNAGMANLDFGRISGHHLSLENDHEIQDSSKFFELESSVNLGMPCCEEGKLILEDSPKPTTSGNTERSRNTPEIEDSKMISSGLFATEELAQKLSISPARQEEYTKRNNYSSLDSRSKWSEYVLPATNIVSSQSSLSQEHTPTSTPTFKRLSCTRTLTAENTPKNIPDSNVRSLSPPSASDAQSGKHPLAVNAGLMNGISKRTSLAASSKERNLQIDFEQSASESTSGQENKRCLDGQFGGAQLHKPKQRKSNSSHRLDQSEAYEDLFSEERLRALEAAGQESLQKKSGAVQHSPPNKTSPNRNPWSPVKKGGQQLGPFDCTKKYTNACVGQ